MVFLGGAGFPQSLEISFVALSVLPFPKRSLQTFWGIKGRL